MDRITFSFTTDEAKENFISDLLKHKYHRIMHIGKEYKKGKSPYRKIRIDLSNK
jgi:hypothetical protein